MSAILQENSTSTNWVPSHFSGILLKDIGKKFNREWIFRHLHYSFEIGKAYALTGPNGSGKSTLLQAIAGSLQISEGKMEYHTINNHKEVDEESIYQYLSIAAPYLELIEEMTAREFLQFHRRFKPFLAHFNELEILSLIHLEKAADKQIRHFSSGMKQRIKLAQAIFSDVPVLLLDEPCTNLDAEGYQLYHQMIEQFAKNKLIIVSSNDANEMDFCTAQINILHYK